MSTQNQQILYAFIIAALVLFILATIIILVVRKHSQKVDLMNREAEALRTEYEKGLLRSKLEVEEQTRKNIAQELHDNIGSLSSLIKINLNLFSVEKNEARKDSLLADTQQLIRQLIAEVKQLSVRMNTERLNQLSFIEMLQFDIAHLRKLDFFTVTFNVQGEEIRLPPDQTIILYRICQEIIHNCLKHARPSAMLIDVCYSTSSLVVRIQDDGIGFQRPASPSSENGDGSGLINMESRVKILNGSLKLFSQPGQGTRCEIFLPIAQPIPDIK